MNSALFFPSCSPFDNSCMQGGKQFSGIKSILASYSSCVFFSGVISDSVFAVWSKLSVMSLMASCGFGFRFQRKGLDSCMQSHCACCLSNVRISFWLIGMETSPDFSLNEYAIL